MDAQRFQTESEDTRLGKERGKTLSLSSASAPKRKERGAGMVNQPYTQKMLKLTLTHSNSYTTRQRGECKGGED